MADLATHLRMMATYNGWANRRFYDAAAALSDDAYRQPVGLYFGSLHGTLNHLLTADRIWMGRLTGTGEAPARVDLILFEDFDALREARVSEDARIQIYTDGLSGEDLAATFEYATTSGTPQAQTRWSTLAHLFNHQTHHRGQAHAALTRLGIAQPPALDLIVMQREQATSGGL